MIGCRCFECTKHKYRELKIGEEVYKLPIVFMNLCSECGNKRCPKATNHVHECTNSNEPGQKGSNYE